MQLSRQHRTVEAYISVRPTVKLLKFCGVAELINIIVKNSKKFQKGIDIS